MLFFSAHVCYPIPVPKVYQLAKHNSGKDKRTRLGLKIIKAGTRLAINQSISMLTRPAVITGFDQSLLVDWWSIGGLKKNG